MKLSVISENTSKISAKFTEKFGLGIVIQVNNKMILIDCGPDDSFIQNMNALNISTEDIDYCIITHGHYDHGGGLQAFLQINTKATIYMSSNCNNDYYSNNLQTKEYKYIGLDRTLFDKYSKRIKLITDDTRIDENTTLNTITKYVGNFFPKMNSEPPRDCRRPNSLRGYGHGQRNTVFT